VRGMFRVAAFAALVAAGTVLEGWWTVPVLATMWVRVLPHARGPVRTCMLGASLGWSALIGWTALEAPLTPLLRRVGGVLQLPDWGLIAVTILFPALLAGAAARAARPAPYR
jgi:hypothetical protein